MKYIVALSRPTDVSASAFAADMLDAARAAGARGTRLALDIAVADDELYERFGRRPTRQPPWHAIVHVHTDDIDERDAIAASVAARGGSAVGWSVQEHVVWPYDRDWPDGEPTPGVKQISFVAKPMSVPGPDFEARYRHHREVAALHHGGAWQYAQNLVVHADTYDPSLQFASVSEMWFRTADDLVEKYYATPTSRTTVQADTVQFIDPALTTWLLVTEHWISSA